MDFLIYILLQNINMDDYVYVLILISKVLFLILGSFVCAFNLLIIVLFLYYKVVKTDQPFTESTTWMTTSIDRDTLFSRLNIPGSHDTLTYDWCDTFNPYQILVSWWAQTQQHSLYNQLMCGCRYFDVRIFFDGIDQKWYNIHGNFVNKNVTYENALKDLQRFCTTYPREIIVWKLNVQKSNDMYPSDLHKTYLDSLLIPYDTKGFDQSVNDLNKKGQVILASDRSYWYYYIYDPYTENDGAIKTPEDGTRILSRIYSNLVYDYGTLPVLQWITVYDTSQFSSIFFPVFYYAHNLNKAIDNWSLPPSPKRDGKYGVIKYDFVTEPFCRKIWKQN
jgi:hypothetical protein